MNMAKETAEMSYANKLRVGAILVRDGRSIVNGYNGMPTGFDNVCEDENGETLDEVIHAEVNVIGYAASQGIATKDCIMVITHVPCFRCAKVILAAKIKEVIYEEEFQQTDSLGFLTKAGIKVTKVEVTNGRH